MKRYKFDGEDVRSHIRNAYGYEGPLLDIYANHTGRRVNKWHHYIPLYDRYLAPYRERPGLRMLEIGVDKGGSLEMWRSYFGPEATIFGIDISEACAAFDGEAGQVRIGSQIDEPFLNSVVEEMGGIDIVLDDGSHKMAHVRESLRLLYPKLNAGGTYIVEDMHTAYYRGFGGGVGNRDNFFNLVRSVFDDMHRWYHPAEPRLEGIGDAVSGVHVHDSFVVLEKGPVHRPAYSLVGG